MKAAALTTRVDRLGAPPRPFAQVSLNPKANRERTIQLFFEEFRAAQCVLAHPPRVSDSVMAGMFAVRDAMAPADLRARRGRYYTCTRATLSLYATGTPVPPLAAASTVRSSVYARTACTADAAPCPVWHIII